jgi:hypothetical protein
MSILIFYQKIGFSYNAFVGFTLKGCNKQPLYDATRYRAKDSVKLTRIISSTCSQLSVYTPDHVQVDKQNRGL